MPPTGQTDACRSSPRARATACQRLLDLLQSGKTPGSVDTVVADWSEAGEPFERLRAIAARLSTRRSAVVWHVVHLKSLTLKGFKSFASPTTLRFEPGITCVVGPNGSGKSNVVDALTWVMGEQGAKTLRGGKMEDVIFAGTSSRAPLGRAEVTLTIDNSDNALPIEYSEVSITRRMFRDGAGEYEINGSSCRLMDVQELLSDSGIGREMHVIVGQGKLSEILESRPEDRRAFIEEAAGVLKHRKRKEKAVRKLDSMSANLARLTDLTTELRRQLKPLGRQAEMARRAADHPGRPARRPAAAGRRRPGQPAGRVQRHQPGRDDAAPRARRADDPAGGRDRRADGPRSRRCPALSERAEAAQQTWFRLSALAERVSATVRIATERAQLLDAEPETVDGRRPRRPGGRGRRGRGARAAAARRAGRVAGTGWRPPAPNWPNANASPPRPNARTWPRSAPRPTAAKAWPGWPARSTPCAPASNPSTRALRGCRSASRKPRPACSRPRPSSRPCRRRVGELDAGEVGLDDHHDRTVAALRLADERVAELQSAERGAERQVASLRARIDALSVGLDRKDGAAWLQKNHSGAGLFGSVAKLVRVRPGLRGGGGGGAGSGRRRRWPPRTSAPLARPSPR